MTLLLVLGACVETGEGTVSTQNSWKTSAFQTQLRNVRNSTLMEGDSLYIEFEIEDQFSFYETAYTCLVDFNLDREVASDAFNCELITGVVFDQDQGILFWQTDESTHDFQEFYEFHIRATRMGSTNQSSLQVRVLNKEHDPEFASFGPYQINEGDIFNLDLNDIHTGTDQDRDGEFIFYTCTFKRVFMSAFQSCNLLAQGVSFNSWSGIFYWDTPENFIDQDEVIEFRVSATDSKVTKDILFSLRMINGNVAPDLIEASTLLAGHEQTSTTNAFFLYKGDKLDQIDFSTKLPGVISCMADSVMNFIQDSGAQTCASLGLIYDSSKEAFVQSDTYLPTGRREVFLSFLTHTIRIDLEDLSRLQDIDQDGERVTYRCVIGAGPTPCHELGVVLNPITGVLQFDTASYPSDSGSFNLNISASDGKSADNEIYSLTMRGLRPRSVLDVGFGEEFGCYIRDDHRVYCFGENENGQLGVGDRNDRSSAFEVNFLNSFKAKSIGLGRRHTCVISIDGELYCFGENSHSKISFQTSNDLLYPFRVPIMTTLTKGRFKEVALGDEHTCALDTEGKIFCFGLNDQGQLGTGDLVAVDKLSKRLTLSSGLGTKTFDSLKCGSSHCCAVDVNRDLICWGDNQFGQLGVGDTTDRLSAVSVASQVIDFDLSRGHTCYVNYNHELYCAGDNSSSQLSSAVVGLSSSSFVLVGDQVSRVKVGSAHTCTLGLIDEIADTAIPGPLNNRAHCFGEGLYGRLGDNSAVDHDVSDPRLVSFINVEKIFADAEQTCLLYRDGLLRCMGRNQSMQLYSASATEVSSPSLLNIASHDHYTELYKVSLSDSHGCVLSQRGKSSCWGDNTFFQLGRDKRSQSAPRPMLGKTTNLFKDLRLSKELSCFINEQSQMQCLGRESLGIKTPASYALEGIDYLRGMSQGWSLDFFEFGALNAFHLCYLNSFDQVHCQGLTMAGDADLASTVLASPRPNNIDERYFSIDHNEEKLCRVSWSGLVDCTSSGHDPTTPLYDHLVSSTSSLRIKQVVMGHEYACLLSYAGDIYCNGSNLHILTSATSLTGLKRLEAKGVDGVDEHFIQVFSSDHNLCALTDQHHVYCIGENAHGQLALGHSNSVSSLKRITKIQTLVYDLHLTDQNLCYSDYDGRVMCVGSNLNDMLGVPSSVYGSSFDFLQLESL